MTKRKIQNQELQNDGNGTLSMSQEQVNETLEGFGITQDIREKLQAAEKTFINEALQVASAEVCDNPELRSATVVLGSGDGQEEITVNAQKEVKDDSAETEEDAVRTEYGHAEIYEHRQFPKSICDEMLPQIRKECKEALGIE